MVQHYYPKGVTGIETTYMEELQVGEPADSTPALPDHRVEPESINTKRL